MDGTSGVTVENTAGEVVKANVTGNFAVATVDGTAAMLRWVGPDGTRFDRELGDAPEQPQK